MRFTKVELTNCRGFEHIEINLDRPFTLLAGVNGSGKTTVLDAIGGGLYVLAKELAGGYFNSHVPSLQRRVRRVSGARITTELVAPSHSNVAARWNEIEQRLQPRSMADPQTEFYDAIAGSNVKPLVARVDALRSIPQRIGARDPDDRVLPYQEWMSLGSDWEWVTKWMSERTSTAHARAFRDSQEKREVHELDWYVPALGIVRKAVSACIDESTDVSYSVEDKEILVTLAGGQMVSVSELSDGYRSFLGTVAELARRCFVLNPDLGADAPLKTPGVVTVDELELHLHPKWQRTIVAGLMKAFPKIQFICATHSPQILSEAPAGSVVLLQPGDVVQYPTFTKGQDADSILENVLDTPARPKEYAARFGELRASIEDGEFDKARTELAALEHDLGASEREVTDARWTLKLEEEMGREPEAP